MGPLRIARVRSPSLVFALAYLLGATAAPAEQPDGRLLLSADRLRRAGTVYLYGDWKYRSGDCASWADPPNSGTALTPSPVFLKLSWIRLSRRARPMMLMPSVTKRITKLNLLAICMVTQQGA